MRKALEPLAFLSLATAVHAGAWVSFGAGSEPGTGAGGTATLSLEMAGPAVAEFVERWDTQPGVSVPAAALMPPDMPRVPEMPTVRTAPPQPVATAPALPDLAKADANPAPDLAMTAPPPDAVRPRPRPERRALRPPEDAATPRPAQSPQRAAGAGQGQTAGQAGTRQGPAASAGQLRALEAAWGAEILARVARNQRYPSGNHGEGTAQVHLTVGRDGQLRSVGLAASSGNAALDRAALAAVRHAGRFPAAPGDLTNASYSFRIPMTFRRN